MYGAGYAGIIGANKGAHFLFHNFFIIVQNTWNKSRYIIFQMRQNLSGRSNNIHVFDIAFGININPVIQCSFR